MNSRHFYFNLKNKMNIIFPFSVIFLFFVYSQKKKIGQSKLFFNEWFVNCFFFNLFNYKIKQKIATKKHKTTSEIKIKEITEQYWFENER